ncbi:hypothetical protein HYALB_00001594 [Hymenoscyphus albidus]|uniref:BTB domain-containing protein n=1 Tax=Hymenoscyphus albidus TaxID=595503 RepID=A0A9N9LDU1_9HELO|nr:hypothetical protein HYALB_00001594 [Hymenoscyphus albidus]
MGTGNGTDTITLSIGSNRDKLIVHRQLICTIPFFQKAFQGNFKEGTGEMDLPEDKSEVVFLLTDWLYRGVVQAINTQAHLDNFYGLYMFAEKICEERLMDMTIDAIQDVSLVRDVYISPKQLFHIYQNTSYRSRLRKFALCLYIQGLPSSLESSQDLDADRKFIAEVQEYMKQNEEMNFDIMYWAMQLGAMRKYFDFRKRGDEDLKFVKADSPCYFHKHKKNDMCYLDMTKEQVAAKKEYQQVWGLQSGKLFLGWG